MDYRLKEIESWMNRTTEKLFSIDDALRMICNTGGRLDQIESSVQGVSNVIEMHIDGVTESLENIFDPEDGCGTLDLIYDKVDTLVNDVHRRHAVSLAQHTLDKFNDYMKNFDKMNAMVNEFKGCVSLARGALGDEVKCRGFNLKIDAIYEIISKMKEEKSPKTSKKSKKPRSSPAAQK